MGEPFSVTRKIFLWLMSITVVFFLLAGLAQRKKLSKIDAVLEDAAIKSAGIDTKLIPRIIIAHACFIIFLILFKRNLFTWFFITLATSLCFGIIAICKLVMQRIVKNWPLPGAITRLIKPRVLRYHR